MHHHMDINSEIMTHLDTELPSNCAACMVIRLCCIVITNSNIRKNLPAQLKELLQIYMGAKMNKKLNTTMKT